MAIKLFSLFWLARRIIKTQSTPPFSGNECECFLETNVNNMNNLFH